MGEIVDLVSAQGMTAGMIYGYVPDPPWGPEHRCPGCQPRPDDPKLAACWDKWQALETKLRKLGESPSCPIARGETLPRSYTNEERLARGGMQTDRLPRHEPRMTPAEPTQAIEMPATVTKIEKLKTPRKAPTKRGPKIPEEQGKLL